MLPGEALGFFPGVLGTDGLRRILEGRIVRVDLHLGEDSRERHVLGQYVAQLLLDHVTDHPFGFGAENVQRVRLDSRERGRLEGEQPHLRSVAVSDDEAVVARQRGQRPGRHLDVRALVLFGERLPPLEQGVAPQRHHDPHFSDRLTRRPP